MHSLTFFKTKDELLMKSYYSLVDHEHRHSQLNECPRGRQATAVHHFLAPRAETKAMKDVRSIQLLLLASNGSAVERITTSLCDIDITASAVVIAVISLHTDSKAPRA